ncbi:MAG: type II toxin-antitoxin system HicA family toxin [Cryomorphaceae bacterium]|nr:type II toxin-antitoxin system HicA family toxin [Cryomorphaceae bacterium]
MKTKRNIALKDFRKFLRHCGFNKIKTTGGHEKWSRKDCLRPITIQSHKCPVPEFIVKNSLNSISDGDKAFEEYFNPNPKKKVKKQPPT